MHALIPPDRPHNLETSASINIELGPEFAEECKRDTLLAIHAYQETECSRLCEELELLPTGFHFLPFHEYIEQEHTCQRNQIHNRASVMASFLGHPSDYYLYNAHKHARGVPHFHHMDCVSDICPTCIRAKQKKEPAGLNTAQTVTEPHQDMSINFSFSGARSKNTLSKFPVGTRVKRSLTDIKRSTIELS